MVNPWRDMNISFTRFKTFPVNTGKDPFEPTSAACFRDVSRSLLLPDACNSALIERHKQKGRGHMEQIIGQLIGGALGGTAGGKAVANSNMGGLGNLIAGAAGGIGGGQILGGLLGMAGGDAGAGMDIGALAGNLVGGGVMGMIVQVVVGMIVKKMRG